MASQESTDAGVFLRIDGDWGGAYPGLAIVECPSDAAGGQPNLSRASSPAVRGVLKHGNAGLIFTQPSFGSAPRPTNVEGAQRHQCFACGEGTESHCARSPLPSSRFPMYPSRSSPYLNQPSASPSPPPYFARGPSTLISDLAPPDQIAISTLAEECDQIWTRLTAKADEMERLSRTLGNCADRFYALYNHYLENNMHTVAAKLVPLMEVGEYALETTLPSPYRPLS